MTAANTTTTDSTLAEWQSWIDSRYSSNRYRSRLFKYIEHLYSQELPILFGLRSIEQHTCVSAATLASIIYQTDAFYRSFSIPKRKGGYRTISAPYPQLLEVQRWISKKILSRVETHDSAHGYVQTRSIVTHATPHLNRAYLLQLDLKDFFPSISHAQVRNVFLSLGYSARISRTLASLCCHEGFLPQGAPTSPALSNIITTRLDNALKEFSVKNSITYTRYADDLAFSWDAEGNQPYSRIDRIIDEQGFQINPLKSHQAGPNQRKFVTGLSISSGKLCIPRTTKREIRKDAHYFLTAPSDHLLSSPSLKDPIYIERLLGRLQFWRYVEPNNSFPKTAIHLLQQRYN